MQDPKKYIERIKAVLEIWGWDGTEEDGIKILAQCAAPVFCMKVFKLYVL